MYVYMMIYETELHHHNEEGLLLLYLWTVVVEIIFTYIYKKICKIFAFRMSICLQLNENCLDENGLQYTVSENVPPKKRIKK